jgi:hypothetical protein
MKKLWLMIFIFIAVLLTGCSQNCITVEEYQKVLREIEELEQALLEKDEYIDVTVNGEFTATVRAFMPDYVLDDSTPLVAVLTIFQSGPFLVHMTEEHISELDIGETYRFKIEDTLIRKNYQVTLSVLEKGVPPVEELFCTYNIRIESFRKPHENELGLESVNLHWERLN